MPTFPSIPRDLLKSLAEMQTTSAPRGLYETYLALRTHPDVVALVANELSEITPREPAYRKARTALDLPENKQTKRQFEQRVFKAETDIQMKCESLAQTTFALDAYPATLIAEVVTRGSGVTDALYAPPLKRDYPAALHPSVNALLEKNIAFEQTLSAFLKKHPMDARFSTSKGPELLGDLVVPHADFAYHLLIGADKLAFQKDGEQFERIAKGALAFMDTAHFRTEYPDLQPHEITRMRTQLNDLCTTFESLQSEAVLLAEQSRRAPASVKQTHHR